MTAADRVRTSSLGLMEKGVLLRILTLLLLLVAGMASPAASRSKGIWISPEEVAQLPVSGVYWEHLRERADQPAGEPNLSDQEQMNNVLVLAKALVFARTNDERYRHEVIDQCMKAMGTEQGGRTLALGRELTAYVIAADLVGLPLQEDAAFKTWLRKVLSELLEGKTLRTTHEVRPNNWGTAAGAARAAVAIYLEDQEELDRTAQVFRGWLGDQSAYQGFTFKNVDWWQADPERPVGVNPKGATRDGHSIDGVLPDDQRRSGEFRWPPPKENYVYTALQGAIVQAAILQRAGYPAFEWQDRALLRAYRWLYDVAHYPAEGDDIWQMPLVDYYYGTHFWDGSVARKCGKNMCWTDWTHGSAASNEKSNHRDPLAVLEKPKPPDSLVLAIRQEGYPQIVSFAPQAAGAGEVVTIYGRNLGDVVQVSFGGVPAIGFEVISDSEIRVEVPDAANSGEIFLTNGTCAASSGVTFERIVTSQRLVFVPTDDARVSAEMYNRNYGTTDTLRLRDDSEGWPAWKSYLKFVVTGLSGEVTSARIRLFVVDSGKHGGTIFRSAASWTEGSIKWNNAPGFQGSPLSAIADVGLNTWVEFDVTSAISGDGIYSFALVPGAGNTTRYSSKEGSYPPQLIIETRN